MKQAHPMRRIAEPEEIAEPAGWQARSPPLALVPGTVAKARLKVSHKPRGDPL